MRLGGGSACSRPLGGKLYFEQISNVAITFKLRAFTENPVPIAAAGSLNLIFSIIVGTTCN